jgi:hypothetical protein
MAYITTGRPWLFRCGRRGDVVLPLRGRAAGRVRPATTAEAAAAGGGTPTPAPRRAKIGPASPLDVMLPPSGSNPGDARISGRSGRPLRGMCGQFRAIYRELLW